MTEKQILESSNIEDLINIDGFLEEILNQGSLKSYLLENNQIRYKLWNNIHKEHLILISALSFKLKEWILKIKPNYYSVYSGLDLHKNYTCNLGNGSIVFYGANEVEAIIKAAAWVYYLKGKS